MSELIVQLAGRRAGRLIRKDNGNLQFRYDEDYDGPPLSQSMPRQADAHPHAVCRAVFGGLLPEGDGRQALARALRISAANDYGLLAEIGGDCAGAITLLEPGAPATTTPRVRTLTAADLDGHLRALPQRPLGVAPEDGVRLSLAGAQPKLPVVADAASVALPLDSATPTTHILKPEPAGYPGLVDNEAFCMQLARAAQLSVASVEKSATPSGLPFLVVERYDRDLTSDPIRRLHQEDTCQALGVPADRKYQSEGGPGVREVVGLLRNATAAPALELPRLWDALVFNWLIGNCDAHGKNFSLLYDAGPPTLAPLYDLVSTTPYELTTRLAMRIGHATHIADVDMRAWHQLAAEIGVREQFATRATTQLIQRVAKASRELIRTEPHRNATARRIAARIVPLSI